MKYFMILLVALLVLQGSVAPPVTKEQEKEEETKENEVEESEELKFEYGRYLQEVVSALESDEKFRKRLQEANDTEIRSGKIAYDLDLVGHHIRTKLDELKRQELERLRHLATKAFEIQNGIDIDDHNKKILEKYEHLDHGNQHSFEIKDLKKLIVKVSKDLEEADKERKEKFKEYEMHKKFEQEQKMQNMTEEDKKKYEHELEELDKKHKEHEPLHHPGSKKQLEEVWEKQDHMEDQEFDPKAFFHMHDLDGNGQWDENELKMLFLQELSKLYEEGHPEDDLNEKAEELERMREHVFNEADTNGDRLISYDEFLIQSKKSEFEQDPGWKTLDQQPIYSDQEYEIYKQHIARGMSPEHASQLAAQGQFPPHPNQIPQHPGEYQHNMHQQQQYYPQGQYPAQVPPQHPGQYNQHQGDYQQAHPQQPQYGQVPQQPPQYHPNDVNYMQQQQNFNPNHQLPVGHVPPPQQYQQPHAAPNTQYHQQPPAAVPNQPPQQQFHQQAPVPNAVPVPQYQQQQPPLQNAVPQQQQYQQQPPVAQQQYPPAGQPQQQQHQPPVAQQQHQPPVAQQQQPPVVQQQQPPVVQQQQQQPPPVAQQQQQQQPPVAQQQYPPAGQPIQQQPPVATNNVNQPPPQQVQQNHPAADSAHGSNQQHAGVVAAQSNH